MGHVCESVETLMLHNMWLLLPPLPDFANILSVKFASLTDGNLARGNGMMHTPWSNPLVALSRATVRVVCAVVQLGLQAYVCLIIHCVPPQCILVGHGYDHDCDS